MSEKEMLEAFTRNLAKAELPKESLEKLAKSVARSPHRAIGIDICKYGICLDLLVDGGIDRFDIREFEDLAIGRVRDIEIFPWGIIRPDLLRVRIGQEL